MFTRLLLLFILVPLAEILLLIQIGDFIGFWPTLGLVLVTGVLGASLARDQGLQIIEQIRREFNQMNVPTDAMLEGLLVLIAGVVLLTPGVLTALNGASGRKKQTTRMLKVTCAACGCIARMARQWLDEVGAPTCACGGDMAEGGAR